MDRCSVHRFDAALRWQPLLLAVVVADADPTSLGGKHASPDGHIELAPRDRLDPYVIALEFENTRLKHPHVFRHYHLFDRYHMDRFR